jgi:hypothetical protein
MGTKTRWALVALAASVLVLGGGIAYASIPDSGGVIHACYAQKDGSLRVIDSPSQTCGSKETALSWNAQGPQGPQGAPGPQGPPGANGVSGYEVVTVHDPAPSGDADITVTCPSGKKALGGGGEETPPFENLGTVVSSRPLIDGTGWRVILHGPGLPGSGNGVDAYATCALA